VLVYGSDVASQYSLLSSTTTQLTDRKMANEMDHALQICHGVACLYEDSRPQLWHPRFSWAWLGVAPDPFILEERSTTAVNDVYDIDTNLSTEETRRGLAESCGISTIPDKSGSLSLPTPNRIQGQRSVYRFSFRRIHRLIPQIWGYGGVVRFRVRLSKIIRSIRHSGHLRHALKNAAGVSLLSIPAFLPTSSAGE
jgi:hypothetical protein